MLSSHFCGVMCTELFIRSRVYASYGLGHGLFYFISLFLDRLFHFKEDQSKIQKSASVKGLVSMTRFYSVISKESYLWSRLHKVISMVSFLRSRFMESFLWSHI